MTELDEKDRALVALVRKTDGISTEDIRVEKYADDRGRDDDTINRCIKAGLIKQIGDSSSDSYALVPSWWPQSRPKPTKK